MNKSTIHWMVVLFWFSEQLGCYVKADLIIWFFWVASRLGYYTLKPGRLEYMLW